MQYWVNSESSSNNVSILADGALVVGSCEEGQVSSVTEKLQSKEDFSVVFGTDNFMVITFSQIESVVARSTENDIDFEYKGKKGLDTLALDFKDQEDKNAFFAALESQLTGKFKKKEVQQSALAAALPSLLAFVFGAGVAALYWNKLRWLTIIVGGLWLLISAYSFYKRFTHPPIVTTLSTRNMVGSAWQKLKVVGSLAVIAVLALAFSTQVTDSYGKKALADHIDADELTAENLPLLVARGSDINSVSNNGWTALHEAIYDDDEALFKVALAEGADPRLAVQDTGTPLDFIIDYERAEMLRIVLDSSSNPSELTKLMPKVISTTDDTNMLSVLYDFKLSPTAHDRLGNNALQLAIANNSSYELVGLLLEKGVPSNVKIEGLTLPAYALKNGQEDVASLFSDKPRDYAKDQALSAEIDGYFLTKIKARFDSASPIVKMILKSEGGVSDDDYQEMMNEATGTFQYKSMLAWGNDLILSSYADLCNANLYKEAESLNKRINYYQNKNSGDIAVAELIFERNRSVYVESKDEYVLPQEIKQKYIAAQLKLIKDFDRFDEGDQSPLIEKCQSMHKRISQKDKPTAQK